jgi:hypothetical protein
MLKYKSALYGKELAILPELDQLMQCGMITVTPVTIIAEQ